MRHEVRGGEGGREKEIEKEKGKESVGRGREKVKCRLEEVKT